jgi:hypothetical protein
MRWPWEFILKTKATDKGATDEVTSPAREEVYRSRSNVSRINALIFLEAREAEKLAMKKNRR